MIDVALVDYLIALMKQLGENEEDRMKVLTIIHLISFIDEYRMEFITKKGLSLLLQCYKEYEHTSRFSRFASCLINLLQGIFV